MDLKVGMQVIGPQGGTYRIVKVFGNEVVLKNRWKTTIPKDRFGVPDGYNLQLPKISLKIIYGSGGKK